MTFRMMPVVAGWLVLLTYGLAMPTLSSCAEVGENGARERRIMLDEDFNWLTREDADRLIEDIVAAGFNVLVPVVWHGRGVSWESEKAPKEPLWANNKNALQDPLRYLIGRAHARGVEVHPWFTVTLRQREFFPQFYDAGTPPKAFNIHSGEFRTFIVDLVTEVVHKYPVDGINLDYIRANGVCTSLKCVNDYRRKTGGDLQNDKENMWRSKVAGERIARWLQEPVADVVERVSGKVREIRPDLIISVDSHPNARWVFLDGGDSVEWANRGWVDLVLDMQYGPELDKEAFESALSRMKRPEKLVLMPGNFERSRFSSDRVWPRDPALVARLVKEARDLGVRSGSVALYEYRFLTKEQIEQLRTGPFYDSPRH